MPDHLHLILETQDPDRERRLIAIEVRAACRAFLPGRKFWSPIPEPRLIPNPLYLKRAIRYVHLNPCRSRLAQDPIEWEWSTHRDVLGVTRESWIEPSRLASLMSCSRARLAEVFHAYVSSDPSVAVGGTVGVKLPRQGELLAATPERCAQAVSAVSRASLAQVYARGPLRDAAIQLSVDGAGHTRQKVQSVLKISDPTMQRALGRPRDERRLAAARIFLTDDRCRKLSGVE